jgi:hypothetical protein
LYRHNSDEAAIPADRKVTETPGVDQNQSGAANGASKADQQQRPRLDRSRVFGCHAGRIYKGMAVVDAEDRLLGYVESVEGELIRLAEGAAGVKAGDSVPLSLIDGIDECRVLLAGRGDTTFGIWAGSP